MILGAGEWGTAGSSQGVWGGSGWVQRGIPPTPRAEWGGKRNEAPPLSAEGKGTWLSLLLPHPVHRRGGVLVPLLSRAQKLFPVEPLEEAFAELISADHDGAGRGGLDDPWEEACSGKGRLGSEVEPQGAPTSPGCGHTHKDAHLQRGPWCLTRPGSSVAAAK